MIRHVLGWTAMGCWALALAGCQAPKGDTSQEKRDYVQQMRQDVLNELYQRQPDARSKVESSAGYGVFTNLSTKIFVLAAGHGYGIVRDKTTGKDTYMRMAEIGGGLGIGAKKLRLVFVFDNASALNTFVNSGWEFGGQADAVAKTGDEGGAASAEGTSGELSGMSVYRITDTGISLSATVAGTKYYRDKELN